MKEYSKLLNKEKLLTQELQHISHKLQLPGPLSDVSWTCELGRELLQVKDVLRRGNIQDIKDAVHAFEEKLSLEKLLLTSKLQDLSLEQVVLLGQVDKLQEIIKNHSSCNNAYYVPVKKEYSVKNVVEEEEYLDFVRKHGTTGGWDSVNHSTFMSLRAKYSDDMDHFYTVCADRIPGMCVSDIQNHEEWFRNYSRLLQNRKNKIQEWKRLKEIEAEKLIKDLENDEVEKEKVEKDSEKQVKKRLEIKKALQEWKEAKSCNEVVVEEAKVDNSKEIEKRKKIKEKVKAYVGRKNQIQALEKELKAVSKELEKKEKDSRFALESEKFKKRDHDFLEKRKEIIHKREKEEFRRKERLQNLVSKVAVGVSRDPKRLMQPTISQQMKVTTPHDECEKVKSKFEAPSIPKRHIPTWRAEI